MQITRGGTPTLRSEQFEPHTGHPSPGVLCGRDKPPWLVGGPLGLTEGLWEAQTLLIGSTHTGLPLRQGGERFALPAAEFLETASQHTSDQVGQKFWPHSLHITVQHRIWDSHDWGEDSTVGRRCDLVPGLSIDGEGVALLELTRCKKSGPDL